MPGKDQAWIELRKRLEHEATLVQARVWHPQTGLVDDLVAEEKQIEVDRSRPEAGPVAGAPELKLDRQQALEKLARTELGLDSRRGVQEARLVEKPDGFGLHERRDGRNLGRGVGIESGKCPPQIALAVTEIRAQADPGRRHARQARCLN